MANQKISQLAPGAPAQATDLVPIDRAGANFSLQVSDIVSEGIVGGGNVGGVLAPGVVYSHTTAGQAAASGAYSTVYTTSAAGIYRVSATIYPTTLSSSAWTVEVAAQVTQNGSTGPEGDELVAATIGTTFGALATTLSRTYALANGATVGIGTFTTTGSNIGGVYTYAVTIERLV
jgi:hypothetical protein